MMAEQRAAVMDQLLSEPARNRLANIKSVKPEKAEKLEMIIIQNAQAGRFNGKVSEEQMIDLMSQLGDIEAAATRVEVARHRFDDDEELDLDNLDL